MIPIEWIEQARARMTRIEKTPVTWDSQHRIYFKWENQQQTGSFKRRGALNKLLTLQDWELQRGLVTASAGNHGQGVALAARECGTKVIVFSPLDTPPVKLAAMRAYGAEVRLVEGGYVAAEAAAMQYAQEYELTWISPYNDAQVVAGQGSLALELFDQIDFKTVEAVFLPVGGGGLLAGSASAIRQRYPQVKVFGVQSSASPFMQVLFHGGNQGEVIEEPSLAEGLAGAIEPYAITIPMIRALADDILLVNEADIRAAISWTWNNFLQKIEGSAAVSVAAALQSEHTGSVVAVITGGNIEDTVFQPILAQASAEDRQ